MAMSDSFAADASGIATPAISLLIIDDEICQDDALVRWLSLEGFRVVAGAATADFTDVDRRILQLQLAGERRTSAYAEACGISHLPLAEQRAGVKLRKDRILQRLRRWGAQFHG